MAQELYLTSLFLDASLKAYYRLENNLTDSSSSAYTLTDNGTTNDASGEFGNARAFASASSQYATGAAANANVTTSQTWLGWVKTATLPGTFLSLLGYRAAGGTPFRGVWVSSANKINYQPSGLTTATVSSVTSVTNGVWTFFAARYDSVGATIAVWINSEKTSVGTSGTMDTIATNNLSLGRIGDDNVEYLNGSLDDVALFTRALSDTEISNYFNGTLPSKFGGAFLLNML